MTREHEALNDDLNKLKDDISNLVNDEYDETDKNRLIQIRSLLEVCIYLAQDL